jgi:hypothetical protein
MSLRDLKFKTEVDMLHRLVDDAGAQYVDFYRRNPSQRRSEKDVIETPTIDSPML